MPKFTCPDCKQPTIRGGGLISRMGGTQVARCMPCSFIREKELGRISGRTLAHKAIANAVKRGSLLPARNFACVDCAKQALDYDHRDYNRPLDVEPVCRSCNKKRGPAIWRTQEEAA